MGAGALLNAAGTITPAVLVLHVLPGCSTEACVPVARALLGVTLTLDALFNLLFGIGLATVAAVLARAERRPFLGILGFSAGVATVPVSLQFALDAAATWLAVAGPLWLAYVAASSVLLWRGRRIVERTATGGRHGALAGAR
jgi:hypothetical protein